MQIHIFQILTADIAARRTSSQPPLRGQSVHNTWLGDKDAGNFDGQRASSAERDTRNASGSRRA